MFWPRLLRSTEEVGLSIYTLQASGLSKLSKETSVTSLLYEPGVDEVS